MAKVQGEGSSSEQTFDEDLLWLQDNHRSQTIWEDPNYEYNLRYYANAPWVLTDPRVKRLVSDAGFGFVESYSKIILDHGLLKALGERWRRETHTFFMRSGEITVTLQDVAMILGLPIDGEAVVAIDTGEENIHDMCDRLLGNSCDDMRRLKKNFLKATWMISVFSTEIPLDATPEVLQCRARAYILYTLGMLFCPDSSGNYVSLKYLPLLENFDFISGYSWGSAVLAYLYSALCECTVPESIHTFKGCAVLLQIWSWEHFHVGRPIVENPFVVDEVCFASFWNGHKTYKEGLKSSQLKLYRDEFDVQEHTQVIWLPYDSHRCSAVSPLCLRGADIYASQVPLFHFDLIEYYHPERVMHQLGIGITIPPNVDRNLDNLHKGSGRIRVTMRPLMLQQWAERENRQFQPDLCSVDDYTNWYANVTRKIIIRPTERQTAAMLGEDVEPSEFMQTTEFHPRGSQMIYQNQLLHDFAINNARLAAESVTRYGDQSGQKWLREAARQLRLLGLDNVLSDILNDFGGLTILPDDVSPPPPSRGVAPQRTRFRRGYD